MHNNVLATLKLKSQFCSEGKITKRILLIKNMYPGYVDLNKFLLFEDKRIQTILQSFCILYYNGFVSAQKIAVQEKCFLCRSVAKQQHLFR